MYATSKILQIRASSTGLRPSIVSRRRTMSHIQNAAKASTHINWVIDDSGSMSSYQYAIRQCVQNIPVPPDHQSHFICFSGDAKYGTDLSSIRYVGGSTNIYAGFCLLNDTLLTNLPLPSKNIVVFISDGADTDNRDIVGRLRSLGGFTRLPDVPSVLFTVAVGSLFPTNMVVDALRPNYHNASDYLPLVFPVNGVGDFEEAFSRLSTYMFEYDHMRTAPLEVTEASSQERMEAAATEVYNYHVLRASRLQDKDAARAELLAAKPQLERIANLIQTRDAKLKSDLAGAKKVDVLKPLVSQRLAKYRQERSSGLSLVRDLSEKLNQLIKENVEGKVLARLSDTELALALGYGNRTGRHLAKSVKYNSAEFSRTKSSLLSYLHSYSPEQAQADGQLMDYIVTQEECITDAREQACDIDRSTINSIVSLVDVLALVGRTLQVKTYDGTQINPWLVEVVGMPHVMKTMNTVDFFERHQGHYRDPARGEEANCLMPVAVGPSPILREYVGQHLTTFCLVRNEALCFSQSLASLAAAAITHCMALPQPLPAWAKDEVSRALATYSCVYESPAGKNPQGLGNRYLTRLGSAAEWRKCLITESPSDEFHTKCEHLTKFILGLAVLITREPASKGNHGLTSERLREMMVAAVAEMAGRAVDRSKPNLNSYFPNCSFQQSVEQLLDHVPMEAALQAITLPDAISLYKKAVSEIITFSHPGAALLQSPTELVHTLSDLGVSHYQFNENVMRNVFASLDSMAGNSAPAGFFALSPSERLNILAHAHEFASSEDRCTQPIKEYSADALAKDLVSAHVRCVLDAAPLRVRGAYQRAMQEAHMGTLLHFPRTFTQRYLSETGRDVETDLGVNAETRLPRNCCSQPACPCFLRRTAPAYTTDGKPRLSDVLLNHLSTGGYAPGHMRCLVLNAGEDEHTLAEKMLSGAALLPCEEATRERAVKTGHAWWTMAQSLGKEYRINSLSATTHTTSSATSTAQIVSAPLPGPISLAQVVTAGTKAFQEAEKQWGGYEQFKRAVDERVYAVSRNEQ